MHLTATGPGGRLFAAIVAVAAGSCLWLAPPPASADGQGLPAATLKELAQARAATARYHDIQNAIADGYIDVNFDPPGVGCHMLNPGLLFDGGIDLERPELLIYDDCSGSRKGGAELRAIEWALPGACSLPVPEGFTGDADVWEVFPADPCGWWTLHAWVWRHNPDGVFVKPNPRVD